MGRVIPFSQFESYLNEIAKRTDFCRSRFAFAISTDFDLGYAVLADAGGSKDVAMPDSKAAEYRHYHFPKG